MCTVVVCMGVYSVCGNKENSDHHYYLIFIYFIMEFIIVYNQQLIDSQYRKNYLANQVGPKHREISVIHRGCEVDSADQPLLCDSGEKRVL